jgi:hypothetical protein
VKLALGLDEMDQVRPIDHGNQELAIHEWDLMYIAVSELRKDNRQVVSFSHRT